MKYEEDIYDMIDQFLLSDLAEHLVAYRLKESVLNLRLAIDSLEHRQRTHGLSVTLRKDLDEYWEDLSALTRTYIYFSGDYDLESLPAWGEIGAPQDMSGWDYWDQGDVK